MSVDADSEAADSPGMNPNSSSTYVVLNVHATAGIATTEDAEGSAWTDALAEVRTYDSLRTAQAAARGASPMGVVATFEYGAAMLERTDNWVPACAGFEVPFWRSGTKYLRVYNPCAASHGWYDMETDLVYPDTQYDCAPWEIGKR